MSIFKPVVSMQQALIRAKLADEADRARRAAEEEARLNEPLTRREVVEAIESVANEYGCAGTHDSDLISNAFARLAAVLS